MYRLAAAALFVVLILAAPALADSFRFTVTADQRMYNRNFGKVLSAMNGAIGDLGEFHVSPGDIDPPAAVRRLIDDHFGRDVIWFPGVGNHEVSSEKVMTWLRDEYQFGNDGRPPLKNFTNQDGPRGSAETNYSWDFGNARFIMLNLYWTGDDAPGSDSASNAVITPQLLDWLEATLADAASAPKPFIFVFGHEPAFPQNRHIGKCLDRDPAARDRFWNLLERYNVTAYITAHTHYYSAYQPPGSSVLQIDVGNAGNDPGDGHTFLNVIVSADQVRFEAWRNRRSRQFFLDECLTLSLQPI